MIEVRHYIDARGRDVFDDWLDEIPDRQAPAKIAVRVERVSQGNFGDCKTLKHGLHELRID